MDKSTSDPFVCNSKLFQIFSLMVALTMRDSVRLRMYRRGTNITLSTKRFDTLCRQFHLLIVTGNRENYRSSECSRVSKRFSRWFLHSLNMRFESQLSPLAHLSPRFNFLPLFCFSITKGKMRWLSFCLNTDFPCYVIRSLFVKAIYGPNQSLVAMITSVRVGSYHRK